MASCTRCENPNILAKQLCPACYMHRYRTGEPRPTHNIVRHGQRLIERRHHTPR